MPAASKDSFAAKDTLTVGENSYDIYKIVGVPGLENAKNLPFSLKVLLENLIRTEDGANITADHIRALADWDPTADPNVEIQFTPARVIMQDFTGVPCVVDLATMREAMADLGGDPDKINPLAPAEMVIDHSVIADVFGRADAFERNVDLEYERNRERYQFLRWGQTAFDEFKVVPPGTGIVHQVNIEHLARVVMYRGGIAYPDSCVGTDSHTTMVNGIGVLGWGVGGIEAEAAMLGQPVSMLIPRVVGFKLTGEIPPGTTATDVVLTITEKLRKHGVVGKFVEFYGAGVGAVPLANRATIGNMSPEFGSTAAMFPIDEETTKYLRLTGRPEEQVALVEAYAKAQGLWHDAEQGAGLLRVPGAGPVDRGAVHRRPEAAAGPDRAVRREELVPQGHPRLRRPERRHPAHQRGRGRRGVVPGQRPARDLLRRRGCRSRGRGRAVIGGRRIVRSARRSRRRCRPAEYGDFVLDHGAVVIAAITSCTNTSNPSVMLGAALLARNAVNRGLSVKPWVKTTMAPGSQVVTDYYEKAGLWPYLEKLGYNLVGYGCTTCIGNSGPLPDEISAAVNEADLTVVSVLSGNRNFEGRINPDVKMNYLASPPLVIAYALAGTMDFDFETQPLGTDDTGTDVYLKDIWPNLQEIQETMASSINKEMFASSYADVFDGGERWKSLPTPEGKTFEWDPESTYVRKPPYFDGMPAQPVPVTDISGARVLAKLGDSVTTDHISPAGAIKPGTPAGQYLTEHGITRKDFNSYGSRRGNHEVMIRGTFANIRLRNQLLDCRLAVQGGYTRDFTQPDAPQAFIYDAAQNYAAQGIPLVVLGGKEYGSGSSRDWAAKGTALLGVRAVIVESFERIHRSNLIGMGVIPLQFPEGETVKTLGLDGDETFDISGITELNNGVTPRTVKVTATKPGGGVVEFDAVVRIDTPGRGGLLPQRRDHAVRAAQPVGRGRITGSNGFVRDTGEDRR